MILESISSDTFSTFFLHLFLVLLTRLFCSQHSFLFTLVNEPSVHGTNEEFSSGLNFRVPKNQAGFHLVPKRSVVLLSKRVRSRQGTRLRFLKFSLFYSSSWLHFFQFVVQSLTTFIKQLVARENAAAQWQRKARENGKIGFLLAPDWPRERYLWSDWFKYGASFPGTSFSCPCSVEKEEEIEIRDWTSRSLVSHFYFLWNQ